MQQPARPTRRAIGKVALIDDQHAIACGGKVLRGARAVDTGADDGDINMQAVKGFQGCLRRCSTPPPPLAP